MSRVPPLLTRARDGARLSNPECLTLAGCDDLDAMMTVAADLRDLGHRSIVSYSSKVFIPLTKLCRNSCHYCTFARAPRRGERSFMTPDEVLAIARAGEAAGCREALFTLGDKPEARYRVAQRELAELGHQTTVSYLVEMAALVLEKTSLLPHLNSGIASTDEIAQMRRVSVSQGLMLETGSIRLSKKGGPHFGSPDKVPAVRLEMIGTAGKLAVPFTSGILSGIGETRSERIAALLQLRDAHERFGHLQEIIIQNFRAKPNTRMASHPEPDLADHLWTIAAARIIFGPTMNIQAPPNLAAGALSRIIDAGINDWGGVSPVTVDHVNPERPWPHLTNLERDTAAAGKQLVERLALYPHYLQQPDRWLDPKLRTAVIRASDAEGLARIDPWRPGAPIKPVAETSTAVGGSSVRSIVSRAANGHELDEQEVAALFSARGSDFREICLTADALRQSDCGRDVTYVVTRNINYTNVCYYKCRFCAFSKGKTHEALRGKPYDLSFEEIQRRALEAWERGGVEVCLQGGIHPAYTGDTYLSILRAVKEACPDIHVHAFSPLEIFQGAVTLGIPVSEFLARLKEAGLGSLPGTAAEILDDEVRKIICPDKITTAQWLEVVESAHRVGLRTTATIMFGHVDRPQHWARHLLRIRQLQERTGGFTEFVPLPFVPMEAPLHLHGLSRLGPTYREAILMHAIARLVLRPYITNIQTSWVKMGPEGASACLQAGANDLGGTLMNESITRAAGATYGQEFSPEEMERLILSIDRRPRQRTTHYGTPTPQCVAASFGAPALLTPIETPAQRRGREPSYEPATH
jgi:FO synthase